MTFFKTLVLAWGVWVGAGIYHKDGAEIDMRL